MDINFLVNLTTRAWSLQILAALSRGVPGRQAALLTATGAGRTAFAQSLAHLVDLQLLERNPGYGHPLRPEFRLTAVGETVAKVAEKLLDTVSDDLELRQVRRVWTLPVLSVVRSERRFSDIKSALGPITDRALSQTLIQLQDRQWVDRDVDVMARPVRPLYRAANTGRILSDLLQTG